MDDELIRQCQRGNAFAQKRLYDTYVNRMYRVCLRYVREETAAEEVLMNGFLKVFHALTHFQYRGEGSLEAWIKRIMVNEALQHLRSTRHLPTLYPEEIVQYEPDVGALPDGQLDAEQILETIRRLPTGYRTVFNLYAIEGYSHREIAEQLSISENTSKSQLSKARIMLQNELIRHGYEATARRRNG
mgnify:CR=1 FL=1